MYEDKTLITMLSM